VNPCLLIPIYEHGSTIRGVVAGLAPLDLPCLVVDDGSDPETLRALDALEAEFPWVQVHRRKRNGGRGAALKTGYRLAAARGFSHVLQLDADGQHDPADAPRFLARVAQHPQAMVLGTPVFDASVPRSRLYGRQISRGMVWLLTLSRDIADPLCGYRALPLAPVVRVLDAVPTGDHMEFDPELAVRLFWEGVPVETLPTRVVYPPGGLSHFDVVWDDLRLAGVYSRFTLAMIPHVPALLARRGGGA
jgi:glycosyltransferase involved in cell wall biosynthesis